MSEEVRSWHAHPPEEAVRWADVDPERGLAPDEAQARLARDGPNALPRKRPPGPLVVLARQFRDPLLWILLAAMGLSLFLGERLEALAIAVILVFTVVLGFVQEYRAQRAMEALREMSAPHATVLRGGQAERIAVRDVVVGDVLLLGQGDIVPADARLLDAADLELAEAALTGESVPVGKGPDAEVPEAAVVGDRSTMVHASTTVARGRATAVVTATGGDTQVGRIGRLLAGVEKVRTPLEKQIAAFSRWLVWAGVGVIVLIVGLGLLRGVDWVEMLLFGVALAVAAVPEALPAVVTISLAVGAQRMARRNAIVRRLPTVETLGSTTVICSDKTGTLTTGEMTVTRVLVADATVTVSGAGFDPHGEFQGVPDGEAGRAWDALLDAAVLCNDASLQGSGADWSVQGDPTEGALLVLGAKAGRTRDDLETRHPRLDERPFSSEDKRMATLHEADGGPVAYVKGAADVLLARSTRRWSHEGVHALDDAGRDGIEKDMESLAGQGMRVLALAMCPEASSDRLDDDLVFLGLVGIRDPPRPEVAAAIQECHEAGIRPVLITGDHPVTAEAVARELGIAVRHTLTGRQVETMGRSDLEEAVLETDVYARVDPEHKLRIVSALQGRGHIVAMTGDGVNDAPALRQAGIGVAMGLTGTDVAKEAADMTLADDDFATIVAAVEEGRTIFDNVRKYIVYLLSTNLGELLLISVAMLLALPLPLTAVMILYVNLLSDGLPAIALAVDPREPDLMQRPPRPPGSALLDRPIIALMVIGGVWAAGVSLAAFLWANGTSRPREVAMTVVLATLVLVQFVMGYSFRTERHALTRRPFANHWYNGAVATSVVLLVLVLYVPPLQALFGTTGLGGTEWLVVLAAALSATPVLEATKAFFRHRAPTARM